MRFRLILQFSLCVLRGGHKQLNSYRLLSPRTETLVFYNANDTDRVIPFSTGRIVLKSLATKSGNPGVRQKRHPDSLKTGFLLAWIILAGLNISVGFAQEARLPSTVRKKISASEIEAVQGLAKDSEALKPEEKTSVAESCTQALADLKAIGTAEDSLKSVQERIANMQTEADSVKKDLEELRANKKPLPPIDELPAAQNDLAKRQQELEDLQDTLPGIEPKQRADRRREARETRVKNQEETEAVKRQLAAPPADGENDILSRSRTISQRVRLRRLSAEFEFLTEQLVLFDREDAVELPRLRRDFAMLQIGKLEVQIAERQKQVLALSRTEAQERVKQAVDKEKESGLKFPVLKAATKLNKEIAEQAKTVTDDNALAEKTLETLKADLQKLAGDLSRIRQNVKTIGLTESIGLRLQKHRTQLKSVADVQTRISERTELIENAHLGFHDADKQYSELRVEEEVQRILSEFKTGDPAKRKELETAARETFSRQHDYLASLVAVYNTYTDTLDSLDITDRTIVRRSDEFRLYIDERVLWIRSHSTLSLSGLKQDISGVSRAGGVVTAIGQWLSQDIQTSIWFYVLAVSLAAIVLYSAAQLRRVSAELGEQVRSRGFFKMVPTLRVLLMTAILSLFWPAILMFMSWRLRQSDSVALHQVANSLVRLALLLFTMEFVRKACRPRGLCEAHFDWPARTCTTVRTSIRQFMLVFLPLFIAANLLNSVRQDSGSDLFERFCFVAAMVALIVLMRRLLHPETGAIRQMLVIHRGGWFEQLRYVWYGIALLIPVCFAVLAVAGYFYTARVLVINLQTTIFFLLLVLFVREVLDRWLLVQSRRLRLGQLKDRRETELKRLASAGEETTVPQVALEEADVNNISEQTRRLMDTSTFVLVLIGIWMIWFNVLPALKLLDQSPLWTTSVQVSEKVMSPDGDVSIRTSSQIEAITIANVVLCLLILLLTFTATRNLPGLLEMSVLQRLPIDADVRYAIGRMVSYAIILVGLLAASKSIGLGWAKVQWLAAALTFGLAFGLQEIFANFVSGIIILIERPIRVGDVVTLDGVSGVISRIRMRATTMTDWDRKEYIVPNKEFITGRLLNWTLTDTVNRVVVNVGVAYGTDTDHVREILISVCQDNEIVLSDPGPIVTFEAFGDSTLDFAVRAYLPNLDNRLKTVHDLHSEINRRFIAHDIEISFPQRDLHVRSMPPNTFNSEQTPDI